VWCGGVWCSRCHLCGDSQQAHSFRTRASAQERAYLRGHGSPSLYVSTLNDGRRSDSTQPHHGHRHLCSPAVEPCRHHLWPTLWAKKSALKRHATPSLTLPFTLSDYSPLCAQVIRQAIRPRNCAWRARSSAEKGTLARGERRVHTTLFTSSIARVMRQHVPLWPWSLFHGTETTTTCSRGTQLLPTTETPRTLCANRPLDACCDASQPVATSVAAVFDVDKLDKVSDQINLTRSGF
jgi:hypothetical protein